MITAFPKIFAIGTDYIKDIFDNEVEITEKVDGSQFAFGKLDGQLQTRSKGQIIYPENAPQMFKKGIEYVLSIEDRIPDNTIFYCEYLEKPKHNALTYERTPKNHLILFGVCDNTQKFVSDYESLKKYAEDLDIEVVPLVYKGKIDIALQIQEFLNRKSILGGADIEGVVVKNYEKQFLLGGQPMPLMSGKYVSEAFKEVHRSSWAGQTTPGKWQLFKESYRTPARWDKAIQHLKENGELENSPRDIGKLLIEIKKDIGQEEKETIKTFLWKEFGDELLRCAIQGFPEFYKQRLLERSFNE